MTRTRSSGGRGGRTRLVLVAAAALAGVAVTGVLSGFHLPLQPIDPDAAESRSELASVVPIGIRTFEAPSDLVVDEDLPYGAREDGTLLTLDVCRPARAAATTDAGTDGAAGALPAVVSIHGGSWARGDKANADWRNVCLWLASEGFVAVSVNYRLVPDAVFPAQLDDVALAVEWLRDPAQAERFGIDPGRIGAFGGSAGGSLAALLGTRGDGPLDTGSRVAAVAELSGPLGLTGLALDADGASPWLRSVVSDYLGCEPGAAACEAAAEASAATHLDPSDPPMFVAQSDAEAIPLGQQTAFVAALQAAGVPVESLVVPGSAHSIGILDAAMRARVAAFLHAALGPVVR